MAAGKALNMHYAREASASKVANCVCDKNPIKGASHAGMPEDIVPTLLNEDQSFAKLNACGQVVQNHL